MALVTQDQALAHLRLLPPLTPQQTTDLDLKIAEASDIVLDYLKTRRTAIASIAAGNPAVVTTSVPHSLTSGASSTIADTTTTPTINGARVITVLSPTTFSVPVDVTDGQSSAAGTVSSSTWTEATVPGPVRSAVFLVLTHLWENRGDDMKADEDLWAAIARLLMRLRDPALA